MSRNGSAAFENRLDALKESVRGLVEMGSERASAIKDRAIDAKDAVARRGGKAINVMGRLIKDHPLAAIGIAFGIGYLVVRLVRR